MSGGMVWLPNNPLMRDEGIPDSHEDGLAYFDDVVGDIGEVSSPARREMFLTAGDEMIDFLVRKGVRLVRCPGLERLLPESQGRQRGRPIGRGNPIRRRRTRRLERQGPAVDGQELRIRRQDQRAARGAVLQPLTARVRRRHARVPAHERRQAPAPRPDDQRCVAHRPDAQDPDRSRRRAADMDRTPRWTTSSSRTAAWSVPEHQPQRRDRECRKRARAFCSPREVSAATPICAAATAATSPTRASGRSPTPATPAKSCRRRWSSARKPTCLDEAWWLPMVFIADPGARITRLRTAAPRRHLHRRHRQAVLQRVELLCRGRQGDVRQQGGAVLAGLRRGLRRPVCVGSEPAEEAHAVRGLDRRRVPSSAPIPSPTWLARSMFPPTRWRRRSSASTGLRPRAWIPTSAAASRRTTSCLGDPGYQARTPRSARSIRRRTTPPGYSRPTSGPAGD